jgi:DNA-binding response OmpR family regulator
MTTKSGTRPGYRTQKASPGDYQIYLLFIFILLSCGQAHESLQNDKMRILLVEDEPHAARILAKGLREQTYAVDLAPDGEEAVYLAYINNYDLIILDVMLPLKGGFEVCRELRANGSAVPILMLTARDAVSDRISGLDLGADDYLIKPFDFHELLARIRALLRRGRTLLPATIEIAGLEIDTHSHEVRREGRLIELTAKEYALLEYLVRHSGEVVSRKDIAEHVWDDNFDPFSNLIEVYIQRLRRKIDEGRSLKLIRTMRGEGYMFRLNKAEGDD